MRAFLAALALALLALPAAADHCSTWSTHAPLVDARLYYVDAADPAVEACPFICSWVYEESNGIAGLQRSDAFHDDTCHGMIPPDTLIF